MADELARQVDQVQVSDEQRTKLYSRLSEDPYRGQLKACRDSGIAGTGGQLREWFKTDPGVQEHLAVARNDYLKTKRLDIDTLLGKVSAIVHNDDSQSQWRAVDWSFSVLHQMGARQAVQVEHTGADGGPIQVEKREVSLTGVLHVLAEAGALPDELAGPLRDLAAARDLLPAQPD